MIIEMDILVLYCDTPQLHRFLYIQKSKLKFEYIILFTICTVNKRQPFALSPSQSSPYSKS
jgi:hypothetical protein